MWLLDRLKKIFKFQEKGSGESGMTLHGPSDIMEETSHKYAGSESTSFQSHFVDESSTSYCDPIKELPVDALFRPHIHFPS